jgi:hypothetical protein
MYFSLHPTTTYNNKTVIDIFRRVIPKLNVLNNISVFTKYDIENGISPENLAYKLYGDSELHWVLLIANNIVNVNKDWPLAPQDFNTYVLKKYPIYDAVHHYEDGDGDVVDGPTNYPITNYTVEERINNKKSNILLIDPFYVSEFVKEFRKLIK